MTLRAASPTRPRRTVPCWLLGWLVLSSWLLAACSPLRGFEAARLVAELGSLQAPGAGPARTRVEFPAADGLAWGYLYRTEPGPARAGLLLVPGAAPLGTDEPLFVALAQSLARHGFAVLTPELSDIRGLKLRPAHAREVADAFAYLAARADLAPGGRAGIGAISYAAGPALLAAIDPAIRDRVRFVFAVGGYHDLTRTVGFLTTGWFDSGGARIHIRPNDHGRLVFAMSGIDYLDDAQDRQVFRAIVDARIADRTANVSALAARLGPQGRALYTLLTNTEPARVRGLLEALPAALRADFAALDLAGKDLAALRARLLLIHGKDDPLVPHPESLALAAAVPPGRARVFLVEQTLGHVELGFSRIASWRFWRHELPDALRLWRAAYLLLAERED